MTPSEDPPSQSLRAQLLRAIVSGESLCHDIDSATLLEQLRRDHTALIFYFLFKNKKLQISLPAKTQDFLVSNDYLAMTQNVLTEEAFTDYLRLSEQHRIRQIILRGTVIATLYYPEHYLRTYNDIDILIATEDSQRLRSFYQEWGLKTEHQFGDEICFTRQAPPALNVDLHTELWYADNFESLWQRRRTLQVGNQFFSILSAEDLLIHIVAHSLIHHGRFSTQDFLDLAFVIKKETTLNWKYIHSFCENRGLIPFFQFALKQLRANGIPIPAGASPILQQNTFAWPAFLNMLIETENKRQLSYLFEFLTSRSWQHAWIKIWCLLNPTDHFLKLRYGLAGHQVILWRLMRPFLLLWQTLKSIYGFIARRHSHALR